MSKHHGFYWVTWHGQAFGFRQMDDALRFWLSLNGLELC